MADLKKKWLNVMNECAKIAKDGYNAFHKYKYATAAGVMEVINPSLVKNGIATTAETELLEMREVTLAQGKTERLATVKVTVTLHDVDGDETLTISGIGGGQDAGDKASMKAQTAAIKYAFMMALEISTGDDPEKDIGTEAYGDRDYSARNYGGGSTVNTSPANTNGKVAGICSECGAEANEKVANYSKQKFGTILCYDCQQKRKISSGGQQPPF